MSRVVLAALVVLLLPFSLFAQRAQLPQSPREALIEMFFSERGGNFEKHLPAATLAAFGGTGIAPGPQGFSGAYKGPGKKLQVFEAGPTLVMAEDSQTGEKFEINIDRDDLTADRDEIELSLHSFKNGQEQSLTAFYPKLTLTMGLEKTVWKLKEIGVALRLPLDDPQFLKGIREFTQNQRTQSEHMQAVSSLSMLRFAEMRYQKTHPDRGFTCSLSELSTVRFGTNPNAAPLVDAALASGTKDNYKFALSGCGSSPVSTYQITAVPQEAGKRAYCADESGKVKYAEDGQGTSCLASGTMLNGSTATGATVLEVTPKADK